MPMTRLSWPKDLEEGLNAHFGMDYRQHPEEWRMYMDTNNSNKAFEEIVEEYGFGAAVVKPEGGDYTRDEGGQGYTSRFTHDTIALSFAMTQEALEDNLYQAKGPKYAKALSRAMQYTKEIRCANVLNNATSGSYLGGDGKSLLATDHPTGAGDQSNKLATAASLSESSIEDTLLMIRNAKDYRGVPIFLKGVRLVVPTALEYAAVRLTQNPQRPDTSNRDISAIYKKSVFANEAAVVTNMTSSTDWGIKTDADEGLILMQRVKLQRGTYEEKGSGNMVYTARERYDEGWGNWRGYYGSAA